jgi:hypothetical protein
MTDEEPEVDPTSFVLTPPPPVKPQATMSYAELRNFYHSVPCLRGYIDATVNGWGRLGTAVRDGTVGFRVVLKDLTYGKPELEDVAQAITSMIRAKEYNESFGIFAPGNATKEPSQ